MRRERHQKDIVGPDVTGPEDFVFDSQTIGKAQNLKFTRGAINTTLGVALAFSAGCSPARPTISQNPEDPGNQNSGEVMSPGEAVDAINTANAVEQANKAFEGTISLESNADQTSFNSQHPEIGDQCSSLGVQVEGSGFQLNGCGEKMFMDINGRWEELPVNSTVDNNPLTVLYAPTGRFNDIGQKEYDPVIWYPTVSKESLDNMTPQDLAEFEVAFMPPAQMPNSVNGYDRETNKPITLKISKDTIQHLPLALKQTSFSAPTEEQMTAVPDSIQVTPKAADFNANIENTKQQIESSLGLNISYTEDHDGKTYAIDANGIAVAEYNGKEFVKYARPTSYAYYSGWYEETTGPNTLAPSPNFSVDKVKPLYYQGQTIPTGFMNSVNSDNTTVISCYITNTPSQAGETEAWNVPCLMQNKYNDYVIAIRFRPDDDSLYNIVPFPANGVLEDDKIGFNIDKMVKHEKAGFDDFVQFNQGVIARVYNQRDVFDNVFQNPEIIGRQVVFGVMMNQIGDEGRPFFQAVKEDRPFNAKELAAMTILQGLPEDLMPESVKKLISNK